MMNKTYNPCDDCRYSYSKNGQESEMCKICEFTYFVKQAPKVGEWLPDENHSHLAKCSLCSYYEYESIAKGDFHNFCPNCGARMKGSNV